jgi:hypothetical protein
MVTARRRRVEMRSFVCDAETEPAGVVGVATKATVPALAPGEATGVRSTAGDARRDATEAGEVADVTQSGSAGTTAPALSKEMVRCTA